MASAATIEFLDQLGIRGVELWVEGDRLRYSAPKGVINDDVLAELRKRKEEIIAVLTARRDADADIIERIARDQPLELSFAQQRIWFLDELEPDNPFYNVALAKRIRGPVDAELLHKALLQLIERHEVLRANCINTDTGPRLKIAGIDEIDAHGDWFAVEQLPADFAETELKARVDDEVSPPLSLASLPLIRVRLYRLGDRDAVLALTTHHFVVDGWSCGVLMRELSQLYGAQVSGKPPALPELTIQYADFANWQNRWLRGPALQEQLKFWEDRLEGLGTLDLPTDKPRPPVQSYRGDIHHFSLPADIGLALKEFSRAQGMTLYMTMLTAFQVLLHRYSRQDEVVLGTAVSNRHSAALESLLGPFVNTLVLRGDLTGNPTFRELLSKTRDVAVEAFAHQDLPFELLVEHLKPERDRSRSPLFQILFVMHQYTGNEELALPGTETEDYPVAPGTSMYDLFLQLIELDNRFSGSIEYSTDLFEHATVVRMTEHFTNLLRGIAGNPDTRILDLPMMDRTETNRLVHKWNATAKPYPGEQQLQELFAAQAEKTPERVAVVCESENITYGELNRAANRLANYLIARQLPNDSRIGIYVERSTSMLVALLGILKAGATYVPLDPLFPAERIRFMMEDSELGGLITQASLIDDLAIKPELTLCIDEPPAELSGAPEITPNISASPDSLAYVIYTSGSTGQPKGVQIPHRAVVNFLTSMAVEPGLTAADTLLAVTTLSFDIAVLELFLPLLNGARLVLATKDVAADGLRLAELIETSGATVMQATPATWQLLLSAGWQGSAGMKILCGGEALPRELADRLLDTGAELWNMYGPTETTIWSSVDRVPRDGAVTIGRPIANTQFYIVDDRLRPVPAGVPGELCIAGDGVARGYFRRPELTAERFVANPFSPGRLLYRTGDLARYRGNGKVECLGRNDNQVKIRGYRMELGEIETVLARHPAVTQAVVTAREDRTGEKRLVGYLIADPAQLESSELEKSKEDQLKQWRDLWQNAYTETEALDPSFNISGWNSSYTGKPIPAADMRIWVESTAARINSLGAQRVLEIGSGTGLLVARVAPNCSHYMATDFSPAAIAAIEQLKAARDDLESVTTLQMTADTLEQLGEHQFDAVIINSVAQYFPDQNYLLGVLRTAARLLTAGGRVFLGDLRSLALLEAYHTSVQLFQAEDSTPVHKLAQTIQQRIAQEEELLLDPAFFQLLHTELPALARVELNMKRGVARNEMSLFRYDAVLTFGTGVPSPSSPAREEWSSIADMADLAARLSSLPEHGLLLTGIGDARLSPELEAMRGIAKADDNDNLTAAELRTIAAQSSGGVEPETLYEMAEASGCEVQLAGTAPGYFNALFNPAGSPCDGRALLPARDLTLAQCSNNPLQGRIQRNLVPTLKDYLRRSLPEYMVPAVYSILEAFPLTPNGKIDRKELPAPDQSIGQSYTPPRNATEEQLVEVWEELLGVAQVGVLDDFFGLGGHSLLATQLVARIRDRFDVKLPLNSLFDSPTVAGLAEAIDSLLWARGDFSDNGSSVGLEEIEI